MHVRQNEVNTQQQMLFRLIADLISSAGFTIGVSTVGY
jgi:hypothetical protein